MKSVKNIIFDLGGVLLNINTAHFAERIQPYSTLNVQDALRTPTISEVLDLYESGDLSDEEFRATCIRELKLSLNDSQFDEAWNAILLDFPRHRIEVLKLLRPHYRTFLLSNTNQIHLDRINLITDLSLLFEKLYFSHQMKMRKPNIAIYQALIDTHDLMPSETIFIDDSLKNVEGASQAGIIGIHLTPGVEIGMLLKKLNVTE